MIPYCSDIVSVVILMEAMAWIVRCKDLRQRSYYLDYFRLRRKLGNVDTIWLQRAIQRINLAIFTAALWDDDLKDLELATEDYFTKVIPRSLECTEWIVDAYLQVRVQSAYRDMLARMATDGAVDAVDVINAYCPRKLKYYNLPAHKSGSERVLPLAAQIVDEVKSAFAFSFTCILIMAC